MSLSFRNDFANLLNKFQKIKPLLIFFWLKHGPFIVMNRTMFPDWLPSVAGTLLRDYKK